MRARLRPHRTTAQVRFSAWSSTCKPPAAVFWNPCRRGQRGVEEGEEGPRVQQTQPHPTSHPIPQRLTVGVSGAVAVDHDLALGSCRAARRPASLEDRLALKLRLSRPGAAVPKKWPEKLRLHARFDMQNAAAGHLPVRPEDRVACVIVCTLMLLMQLTDSDRVSNTGSWCGSADDPCLFIWLNTSFAPPIGRVSIGSCPVGWLAGRLADGKPLPASGSRILNSLIPITIRPPQCSLPCFARAVPIEPGCAVCLGNSVGGPSVRG